MSSTKVLVTGAAGFIGSHVVDSLLQAGHDVVALDDLSGGAVENVSPGANFVRGSVEDDALITGLFGQQRFDYVFHLAAYAAEGLSHFVRRFNYRNNLIGSVNLVNAAVNAGTVQCFVFTSSIAVYGKAQPPMTEETVPRPEDPYGIAKLAVEHDLAASFELFGMPYIIFRPHNVYGPRQNLGDRYRNVIGIFMNQAMRGEPFTIFGDGTQTRAFSYIDDVAPVIARSIGSPGAYNQVYNVGAEEPQSVGALASIVAGAMNVPLRVTYLPHRSEVVHAYSSHSKVRAAFGQAGAAVPLKEGVSRMADWARQHGVAQASWSPPIEVEKNLPPSWKANVKTEKALAHDS